jgi:hypothetical protein
MFINWFHESKENREMRQSKGLKKLNKKEAIGSLINVIKRLRSSSGCPWDSKQTQEKIVQSHSPFLREAGERNKNIVAHNIKKMKILIYIITSCKKIWLFF